MTSKTAVDESLDLLLGEHEEVRKLFDIHQRALLAGDVENAVSILSKFRDDLERHVGFEEAWLLPKYAQEGGETAGGTLTIFQAEHRKLKDMMEALFREALGLYTATDLDGAIISILDKEALFKSLLEHHMHREQNILLPRLEARTTPAERKELLVKRVAPKAIESPIVP